MPGGMLQKKHSNPGETPPRQGIRPSTCSDRNIPHGEKANKKSYDRRKGTSHRGMHPPFSFVQSPAGEYVQTQEAPRRPVQNGTLRPEVYGKQIPPFPQRNMFRPAPSAVHVPSSHGKTPSPIPRREGCGIFSLPAGKRTKKSPAGGGAVRLKAAGL